MTITPGEIATVVVPIVTAIVGALTGSRVQRRRDLMAGAKVASSTSEAWAKITDRLDQLDAAKAREVLDLRSQIASLHLELLDTQSSSERCEQRFRALARAYAALAGRRESTQEIERELFEMIVAAGPSSVVDIEVITDDIPTGSDDS